MAMFVWPDGTVTGSVNVDEKERIDAALKGLGKRQLAALQWPIESAAQVTAPEPDAEPVADAEPEPTMVKVMAELAPEAEPPVAKTTKKEKS